MSSKKVTVIFRGPDLEDGSMDVRELAPALLAFGDLITEANRTLNEDRADVRVKIQSDFRKGSFEVHLQVAQEFLQTTQGLYDGFSITKANEILKLLGLPGLVGSVYAVFRWINSRKAKPNKIIEKSQGDDSIVLEVTEKRSNKEVTRRLKLPAKTAKLFREPAIRRQFGQFLRPLRQKGVKQIEVQSGNKKPQVFNVQDAEAVEDMANLEFGPDAPPYVESNFERLLRPGKINFKLEVGTKWTLYDESTSLSVSVFDKSFIRKVNDGTYRFGKNDLLRAKIRSRQWVQPARTENDLIEIVEVITPKKVRQLTLISPPEDDPE